MEFHEAADFLFDLRRFAPRPGLDPTRELLDHVGDPHERLDCVQVAGSNGKGSTARMVERALREAGLSVGLYTSPHLDDVRERVRVDGRPMTESAVTEFVESFREYATERATDGDSPTFFETLTAMALWEFDRQDVDVAVLEVGIGGSLDATSVVDPIASAVTAVTLEHTDLLGDTVGEIARDKSGVEPADAPLVTAATGDALAAIREEVDEVLTVADAEWREPEDPDVTVAYGGREGLEGAVTVEGNGSLDGGDEAGDGGWAVDTRLPLLGAHQARNAGVAAALVGQVADRLGVDAATAAVERGFRNAHWPGRFEVMDREPLVVLDGAHNPGGCETTADVLSTFDYDEAHLVVGAMTDKDHRGIAAAFADADLGRVVACRPDHDRAESAEVVASAFEAETGADVRTHEPVAGALDRALDAAGPDDAVVVSGSLYAVAEARTRWSRPAVPLDVDSVADAEAALARAHVGEADATAAAGDAVHRVLRMRLRPRRARRLQSELRALGGEVALSALADQDEERVDAVAMATRAQFDRLADALAGREDDLAPLADEIRAGLGASPTPNAATPTPDAERSAADRDYPWADGTAVMGILNITPDSFHDGGEYNTVADARERAERMVDAGVEILDIGGESTRPGGEVVPAEEEIERVVPVVEAVSDLDAMVSIDTRKAEVARAALDAGADLLNDVSGLEDPEMRLVAAEYDVPVVVMHSIEAPVDPTTEVEYDDVVDDVIDYLAERVLLAEKAGLDRSQILVDPGLGFGKSAAESFELLGRLDELAALGCPILVGHSRKSMFDLTEGGREGALDETVAGTALAAERGADVIRVHDAHENVAAVRVAQAAADPDRFDEE
ncbi:dihydropteroate synthase [Halosimplex pelagicum]|uniref:Probable bifunctional folylpolyglutamate synthase/dihydropteroate synthase n=1 Tax=Halosimplex pelagicum TaxID=869886 RepID=A0A7D5PAI2_9EURY|nr:dihydropteroate synthase [Halosimplex pelagicum]QLH81805.1 dihydropteroate synthase [Halosimplex pelagicum]